MAQPPTTPSRLRIVKATALALLVAAVLLVTAILPAEYGVDPLRTGRFLGLLALADSGSGAITPQDERYRSDTKEFVLGPYEFVEYKYRMEQGSGMLYSWQATSSVISDFHSEPDGAAPGYAESFDKREGSQAHGVYQAPFPGVHGWYWENPALRDVRIRLHTSGFYSAAKEYMGGNIIDHALSDDNGERAP